MNPAADQQQQDKADVPPAPLVDYLDIETQLLRRIPGWQCGEGAVRARDVLFQMFAHRTIET